MLDDKHKTQHIELIVALNLLFKKQTSLRYLIINVPKISHCKVLKGTEPLFLLWSVSLGSMQMHFEYPV